MASRLCLHFETTLFGALDSLGNFNDILRTDDSSWNHWELEIERLRPLSEERITRKIDRKKDASEAFVQASVRKQTVLMVPAVATRYEPQLDGVGRPRRCLCTA
uniref:Uncharacterized protein n=1 Tax=Fusarium oxysporum (strain Fo5176) TaxID=660025 RepID=A0A0D2XER6_FUSOF